MENPQTLPPPKNSEEAMNVIKAALQQMNLKWHEHLYLANCLKLLYDNAVQNESSEREGCCQK